MVDALRRAHLMLTPGGIVVDLHPTATAGSIDVEAIVTGYVDAGDAPLRHAAAGVAIAAVVGEGLFAIDQVTEFDFYTYADSIEELRGYIEENWRNAHVDDETVRRTREALRGRAGVRPRSRERVVVTTLRRRPV